MAGLRCFGSVAATLLLSSALVDARHAPVFRHKAQGLEERQQNQPMGGPPAAFAATTTSNEVLAFITPSPGADPVPITSQSQTVTSYIAQYTLCALPPVAEVAIPRTSGAPFGNYSTSYAQSWGTGVGSCTTQYNPTVTTVCATVLEDLVSKYTVTSCTQDITFSTQYGYVLATPTISASNATKNATRPISYTNASTITPAPTIQTLTTYFMAPWQELTTAAMPKDIDLKVCTTYSNGSEICVIEFQRWSTSLVTHTTTTVTTLDFTTQLFQLSQLIFETITANITETLRSYSLFTTVDVSWTVETETTSTASRAGSFTTGPTVYVTSTLQEASPGLT